MGVKKVHVTKTSGEKAQFSLRKLRESLRRSGASKAVAERIVSRMREEIYPGIATGQLFNRAYALLQEENAALACRYRLKKALYELGPTGFPFENYVARVLARMGYKTQVSEQVPGQCVNHEVDVMARNDGEVIMVECKFHSDPSRKCDVKIPLYIHSRFLDIQARWNKGKNGRALVQGWLVTNTRFTQDAVRYGTCCGLFLMSWDYPHDHALKDLIDRFQLYPVTASGLLSGSEKEYLLARNVVLLAQVPREVHLLDHLGIAESRKKKIIAEARELCGPGLP